MYSSTSEELANKENPPLNIYDDKCNRLLQEEDIRFAGIVNENGELISGGFTSGLSPLEGDETKLKSFLEFVSKISIRNEYDESLGPINYLAARRDKVVLISFPFPITRIILLISAEPAVDIEKIAERVVDVFSGIS